MDSRLEFHREEFAARVREKRHEAKMTQAELAEALGYSDENGKGIISKIEHGKVEPPLSKINSFARVLNTSCAYLLGWDAPAESKEDLHAVAPSLSEDELDLLSMFAQLNSHGRQTARSVISGMLLNSEFVSRSSEDMDASSAS